eukprot:Nk52_evm2s266 gene=Nk52_evmTU2s266
MSLADALLADLESDEEEEELQPQQVGNPVLPSSFSNKKDDMDVDMKEAFEEDFKSNKGHKSGHDGSQKGPQVEKSALQRIATVAPLQQSTEYEQVVEEIRKHFDSSMTVTSNANRKITGPVENDPEYKLIVRGNNLSSKIDREISVVHNYIRDIYTERFPELDQLVVMPMSYIRTVQAIGDAKDITRVNLSHILPSATVVVVNITAATTRGRPLPEQTLSCVLEACAMALQLEDVKQMIVKYVESRMNLVAPNLSAIVGPYTAARLMTFAGGLTALSKMPSCNVQVLGSSKQTSAAGGGSASGAVYVPSGNSASSSLQHCGIVYFTELVQNVQSDYRMKVARLVAAKCTLAARIDSFHESNEGATGRKFREEIQSRVDKMQEAAPLKVVKPLKAPDEAPKKRRGGKRVRKMKEKYATTEFRKAANRMTFGEIGEDINQEDLGYDLGQVKKDGRVRGASTNKTKISISKRLQKELAKQKASGMGGTATAMHGTGMGTSAVAGTVSTVAFTPVQGLEIINPQLTADRLKEVNDKYFGKGKYAKVEKK